MFLLFRILMVAGALIAPALPASAGAMPVVCGTPAVATWGKGQICKQGSEWWVTVYDLKTDGSCVYAVRDDGSRIAKACTSSGVTSGPQTGTIWARATNGSRYMTIPVP